MIMVFIKSHQLVSQGVPWSGQSSPPTPQQAAHRGATCSPSSPAGGGAAALKPRRKSTSPSSPAVQPVQAVLPVQPVTPREMLRRREVGRAGEGLKKAPGGLTQAQCSHMCAFAALPTKPIRVIDRHHSSCYTARFSPDGNKFVGACRLLYVLPPSPTLRIRLIVKYNNSILNFTYPARDQMCIVECRVGKSS
jgi:hypothetical protein